MVYLIAYNFTSNFLEKNNSNHQLVIPNIPGIASSLPEEPPPLKRSEVTKLFWSGVLVPDPTSLPGGQAPKYLKSYWSKKNLYIIISPISKLQKLPMTKGPTKKT